MQCEKCYRYFPRKDWPPKREGMVAFIGQARLGEQGHLPNRRPVYDVRIPKLGQVRLNMPLMDGLGDE